MFGFGWSESEREEIAKEIAGTHTAYGSGWGGVPTTTDDDDENE